MTRQSPHSPRCRGFTLIEVSIALVILSMIMLATVSSLRSFGNTQVKVDEVTARVGEMRVVGKFLRAAIEGAMPVPNAGQGTLFPDGDDQAGRRVGTLFWGSRQQMIWAAPLSGGPDFGGLYAVRLNRDDDRLLLRWQPYKRGGNWREWESIKPHVLTEGVESIALDYRITWHQDWVTEWMPANTNPVAVRLNLKVNGRFWPELVVRLDDGRMNSL